MAGRTIDATRYVRENKGFRTPSISIDLHGSWDKECPWSTQLNKVIKETVAWPMYQWDSAAKKRCLEYNKQAIMLALDALTTAHTNRRFLDEGVTSPYICHELESLLDGAPSKKITKVTKVPHGARVVKDSIHLRMEKEDVSTMLVKEIDGRRWRAESIEWSVPLSSCLDLLAALDSNVECATLASQVRALPQVSTYLEGKVERIAISSATSLDNPMVLEDMKKRLVIAFNEGKFLYDFQYVGVRYAELSGGRCLLGDDMGIGKTIQAIGYAALHPELWPVLIVAPANVQYNWRNEILDWVKDVTVQVVEKGGDKLEDVDFTVITYNKMPKQESNLLKRNFNLIVFDECHYIKNYKAKRTQSSIKVAQDSQSVVCMSGTPISNRPIDFFNVLQMLRPADWKGKWVDYVKRYCNGRSPEESMSGYWETDGSSNEAELHALCRDFMIRRLKKEVLTQLPDQVRQLYTVQPSDDELEDYMDTQESWVEQYEMYREHKGMPAGFVLNMMTDLRKLCGHLKVNSAAQYIEEYRLANDNKPIIVFAHHRDVLSECIDACISKGLATRTSVASITGEVTSKKRQEIVERFQAGEIDILFCSTIAAKEGLTLTAADTTVFLEREWVSGWEEQAEGRVNRIGATTDTCWAVYLTVDGTIDQHFNRVVEEKRKVISSIVDGANNAGDRVEVMEQILQGMVESGQVPASMLDDYRQGKGNNKGAKKYD